MVTLWLISYTVRSQSRLPMNKLAGRAAIAAHVGPNTATAIMSPASEALIVSRLFIRTENKSPSRTIAAKMQVPKTRRGSSTYPYQ